VPPCTLIWLFYLKSLRLCTQKVWRALETSCIPSLSLYEEHNANSLYKFPISNLYFTIVLPLNVCNKETRKNRSVPPRKVTQRHISQQNSELLNPTAGKTYLHKQATKFTISMVWKKKGACPVNSDSLK
jgi:hypothetical protein